VGPAGSMAPPSRGSRAEERLLTRSCSPAVISPATGMAPACPTHLGASIEVGDGRAEPPEVARRHSWRHDGGARWCAGHLWPVEVQLGLTLALGCHGEREGRERRWRGTLGGAGHGAPNSDEVAVARKCKMWPHLRSIGYAEITTS
jgi:hypothetical protein